MGLARLLPSRFAPPRHPEGGRLPFTFLDFPSLDSGPVDRDQAEGLPGVGHGVRLISGVIGQLRPRPVMDAEDPAKPTVGRSRIPMLDDPDPVKPGGVAAWLTSVAADLAWHGNAYGYVGPEVCDERGWPRQVPLIDPDWVTWDQLDGYRVNGTPADTLVHAVRNPRSGLQLGRGILDAYQPGLRLIRAAEHAAFVLVDKGRPSGILTTEENLTDDELAGYKQALLRAFRTDGVAALVKADYKPIAFNAEDLQLVPGREFNLRLASDITGVPPYMLGVPSESRVYSNFGNEWTNFTRGTLAHYTLPIEAMLTRCVPRGTTVQLGADTLARGDLRGLVEIYGLLITSGVITPDEVRADRSGLLGSLLGPIIDSTTTPPPEEGQP